MESFYRPTWAEISLDALRHNLQAVRLALPPGCKLMASVKANAYGHGLVEIAGAAERFGVDYLGVAFLDEALKLREAGIQSPILVFGFVPAEGLRAAREHDITISLFREDIRQAAEMLPPEGKKLKAHIKLDSGMGRLGVLGFQEAMAFIERSLQTPTLHVEGMFTHYAKADERDKSYTQQQYERFREVAEAVKQRGWPLEIMHAANSAAGIDTPEWAGGMVRLGISMYGLYPSTEVNRQRIALQPVLSLKSRLVHVKQAPPGWGISYGTRHVTSGEEWIGTLPIGYADGFSRMLTGKGNVLMRGKRIPVLGTICMDQCMIALDAVSYADNPVKTDEEAVIIGRQGDEMISVEELADQLGTINYEVICMIAERVPRVYIEDGSKAAVRNALA